MTATLSQRLILKQDIFIHIFVLFLNNTLYDRQNHKNSLRSCRLFQGKHCFICGCNRSVNTPYEITKPRSPGITFIGRSFIFGSVISVHVSNSNHSAKQWSPFWLQRVCTVCVYAAVSKVNFKIYSAVNAFSKTLQQTDTSSQPLFGVSWKLNFTIKPM